MSRLFELAYTIGLLAVSPWLLYRLLRSSGLDSLGQRFGAGLGPPVSGAFWLHGASAGEISLLRPIVAHLERTLPDAPIVITAYTSTGLAAARRAFPAHRVVYFPLDLPGIVHGVLARFDPRLIVIVESEYWPMLLRAAQRRGVPVVVLNGKMSPRSCRAYRLTRIVAAALARCELIAVQSEAHAERFRQLGVPASRIAVTGNMKYDLAPAPAGARPRGERRASLGYDNDDVIVIGGSLHSGEHEALIGAFAALDGRASDSTAFDASPPRAALIVVPRYPADADDVERAAAASGLRSVRKTAIDRGVARAPGAQGVLIVDTIGELVDLYAIADVAFVGGSLFFRAGNKGGHNLMEPAAAGVPVLFGPYNFSFRDLVDDLLAQGAGVQVNDSGELEQALRGFVADTERRREVGESGRRVVLAGRGATRRNCELLDRVIGTRARLQGQVFNSTMPRASGHVDIR